MEWKSFGKMISTTVAVIALTFFIAPAANAANFCLAFGTARVAASGLTLPVKGACAAFNGFYLGRSGFLLAGEVCRSSDGSTYLFNTFTQFMGRPDSLVGTWAASSGNGSGTECSTAPCVTFAVAVIKCPNNVNVPSALLNFESEIPSETSSSSLTQ